MTKRDIIAALRALDAKDLTEVRTHIAARLERSDGARDDSAAARVYHVIVDEMRRAGLIDSGLVSYKRLPRFSAKDYTAKAAWLAEWLNTQHHDRRVQDAILRNGIQLLIRGYRDRVRPLTITPQLLCSDINTLPAVLDRDFPGYAAAGLLHLIAGPTPPPHLALVR